MPACLPRCRPPCRGAGTGPSGRQGGGQPCLSGARRARIRHMERTPLHRRRPRPRAHPRRSHGTSPSTPAPVRMDTRTRRSQAAPGTGRRPGRQPHRTRADGCEPARSVGNTNPKVLCGRPPRPRQGSLRPWRPRAIRVSSSRGCGRRTPRNTAPDVVPETSPPQCGLGSLLVVVGTWPRTETDVNDECGLAKHFNHGPDCLRPTGC